MCNCCRFRMVCVFAVERYFLTSVLNCIMRGDVIEWKTQTAKIDLIDKYKRRLDWLAMEYEGETFPKGIS